MTQNIVLFQYMGGKSRFTPQIKPYIPLSISHYVEPFCGSAALFFSNENGWSNSEVLNDTNGDIINFFRVLRQGPDRFAWLAKYTPFSRDEFYVALKIIRSGEGSPECRALAFYISRVQSIMGAGISWTGSSTSEKNETLRQANKELLLLRAAERLKNAILDNLPYQKIIDKYDGPNTFFYIDPPYLSLKDNSMTERAYRGGFFGENDHLELLELIQKLQGYVILSGYDHPIYAEINKEWHRIVIPSHVKTPESQHETEEIILINQKCYQDKIQRDSKIKQMRLEI